MAITVNRNPVRQKPKRPPNELLDQNWGLTPDDFGYVHDGGYMTGSHGFPVGQGTDNAARASSLPMMGTPNTPNANNSVTPGGPGSMSVAPGAGTGETVRMPGGGSTGGVNLGTLLGDPQGRFMRHQDRMKGQVPVLDLFSATQATSPGLGRSRDAGTRRAAHDMVAGSQIRAANQRANIPMQLYDQQADEIMGLNQLGTAADSLGIQDRNQTLAPFLNALLGAQRSLYGATSSGAGSLLGNLLGGSFV